MMKFVQKLIAAIVYVCVQVNRSTLAGYLKAIGFIIYVLFVFCTHTFNISAVSNIFLFFIDIPVCTYLVCCIHESAHFLFFLYAGAEVRAVRLGIIRIFRYKGKVKAELTNCNMFTGSCVVKNTDYKGKSYMIAALLSGGISSILLAAIIFLYMLLVHNKISPFLLCMALAGLISGSFSLFYSGSADRKLLKLFWKK